MARNSDCSLGDPGEEAVNIAAAAGASGTNFIQLPTMRADAQGHAASDSCDDCNAAGDRWFNAAIANPLWNALKSSQSGRAFAEIGFSLDEITKVSSSRRSER